MENKIECEHCKNSFDSEKVLIQHTNAKHPKINSDKNTGTKLPRAKQAVA